MELNVQFPDPRTASNEGLVAVGGELSPDYLIAAYAQGVFPWYNEGDPVLWWSPNPRMVLFPENYKLSKSMRKLIKSGDYEIRVDTDFKSVITNCGKMERRDQQGTWITKDIYDAYNELHDMGIVHSFETYQNDELVGGLYGLSLGKVFFGESMFFKKTNASKFAFYHLVEWCRLNDFDFIDAQQSTAHLRSLGAEDIPRESFLEILDESLSHSTLQGRWRF